MESKYQRYNEGLVNKISESLSVYRSASDAAKDMGIDVSGLIKHIKNTASSKKQANLISVLIRLFVKRETKPAINAGT